LATINVERLVEAFIEFRDKEGLVKVKISDTVEIQRIFYPLQSIKTVLVFNMASKSNGNEQGKVQTVSTKKRKGTSRRMKNPEQCSKEERD